MMIWKMDTEQNKEEKESVIHMHQKFGLPTWTPGQLLMPTGTPRGCIFSVSSAFCEPILLSELPITMCFPIGDGQCEQDMMLWVL